MYWFHKVKEMQNTHNKLRENRISVSKRQLIEDRTKVDHYFYHNLRNVPKEVLERM